MLNTGLQIHTCGHFSGQPDHYMARSQPTDHLLIWVLGGRGHAKVGRQSVQAQPGDLLVFPKGLPHAYGSSQTDPWDIVWVHFEGHNAGQFIRFFAQQGNLRLPLGLDTTLRDRFEELVLYHSGASADRQRLCDCLLWGLLGLIVHRLELQGQVIDERLPTLGRRLQKYVQAHLASPLHMDDLARVAGVSQRQATRLFHQLFRTSPMQYVLQQRVARAAMLLSETDWSIKKIALEVGCGDPYYFSRLFRQHMHLSPSQWRDRSRR